MPAVTKQKPMNEPRKYEGVPFVQYPGRHTEVRESTEPPPAGWVHLNEAAAGQVNTKETTPRRHHARPLCLAEYDRKIRKSDDGFT